MDARLTAFGLATSNLFVNAEARYRYLNRLVSHYRQGVDTVETTVGLGWRF